ncbi:MAG: Pycsar system effector family protein [Solirubrobacteraceae bacterium]
MLHRRRRSVERDLPPADGGLTVGREFGWHAHEAVQGWTANVDIKSSIVVVIETAVAGAGAKALITAKGELHSATGLQLACAICAVTFLVLAVAAALWVVFPRLKRHRTAALAASGAIYFGHLRKRSAEDLHDALAAMTPDEELRQLALQLHAAGGVAWRKHAWLQCSLVLFAIGSALLVLAFAAF